MAKVKQHGKKRALKRVRVKGGLKQRPNVFTGTCTEEEEAKMFEDFRNLHINTKARRNQFVREYIKDFNGAEAILRMGYTCQRNTAQSMAGKWLSEPYTQYALSELMRDMDEKAVVSRNEILFGLKSEANVFGEEGSHSARISAWRALAKINGMEITRVEGNIGLAAGGVMAVPYVGTVEDWERMTRESQAKLKAAVRV